MANSVRLRVCVVPSSRNVRKHTPVYRVGRVLAWKWVCSPYLDQNLCLYSKLNMLMLLNIHGELLSL